MNSLYLYTWDNDSGISRERRKHHSCTVHKPGCPFNEAYDSSIFFIKTKPTLVKSRTAVC